MEDGPVAVVGHDVVALAGRQAELPETFSAFSAGERSVDQVTVVARHVRAAFDVDAAELARRATVAQLNEFDAAASTASDVAG